jgi:hypothetical protein
MDVIVSAFRFVSTKTDQAHATPGGTLQPIGSPLGRVIYRDGKFLVVLGPNVLEVAPE